MPPRPEPSLLAQVVHVAVNADFMCNRYYPHRPPIFSHAIDAEIGMVQMMRNAVVITKATADFMPAVVRPKYWHLPKQYCAEDRFKSPPKYATWGLDWRRRAPANNTDHGPAGPIAPGKLREAWM